MGKTEPLELGAGARRRLLALTNRRTAPAGEVRRARVVLLAADGISGADIARQVGLSEQSVCAIRKRFERDGVAGIADRPKTGRHDHAVPPEMVERIVAMALSPPPAGHSRWSSRRIARRLGYSSPTVAKVLRTNDIKPHRTRTFKVSRDPAFAEKVRDVVGLYLNPPANAVVLSMDEKTQMQALERTQPMLPLRQGKIVRHTHDYKRHGVLDLYAAINVATGELTHRMTETHKAKDFLAFLKKIERTYRGRELHVILDNSSSHTAEEIAPWLAERPHIHFHFTPTGASWLNQIEAVFGILTRQSLRPTSFPSKTALRQHVEAYIRDWNKHPRPFIWTKTPGRIVRDHRRIVNAMSLAVH